MVDRYRALKPSRYQALLDAVATGGEAATGSGEPQAPLATGVASVSANYFQEPAATGAAGSAEKRKLPSRWQDKSIDG